MAPGTGATELIPGRRRGSSRHRDERSGALPGWLAWLVDRGVALISLLPVLLAVVLVQSLSPLAQQTPTGPARYELAGAWLARDPTALAGYDQWTAAPPFGWVQLGALLQVLQAGSAQSVLAAAHGAMLLLTLAQAALLWLLLRRGGASGLAAGAATGVVAVVPSALLAHTAVSGTAIAVVWVLAAAVLLTMGRLPGSGVLAGIAAAAAVLTAPVAALPVAAVAVQALRPAPQRRRGTGTATVVSRRRLVAAGVALAAVLVASRVLVGLLAAQPQTAAGTRLEQLGQAAGQAQWGVGSATAMTWLAVDPVALLVLVAAVALVAPLPAYRVLVGLAVVLAIVAFWPLGTDAVAPMLLLLPVTAVAAAAMVDRAVLALGDPAFRRSVVGSAWLTGVAAVLIVGAVAWLLSLADLTQGRDQPIARADAWLRQSVPRGQVVLVDLGLWPDLSRDRSLRVGWFAAGAAGLASSTPWRTADYVLADGSLTSARGAGVRRVLATSLPVAGFGGGASRIEVRAVQRATSTPTLSPTQPSTAAERQAAAARRSVGAQLAENPRITLTGSDRAALLAGQVDARVAIVLAQFVTGHRIVVAAFPSVAGDDGVRREVVISAVDGRRIPEDGTATGALLRYLSSLRGQYAAQSIDATDDGLLATFAADPTFTP